MSNLIAALGPQILSVLLPLLASEIAGRKVKTLPRTWIPWLSVILGGLTSALPGVPATFSPMDGATGGALAVAANEAMKAFRSPKASAAPKK